MLITVETLLEFVLKFCLNLLKLFFHKWLGMQCMPCMHGEYAPATCLSIRPSSRASRKHFGQILLAALWLPLQLAHFIAITFVTLQEDELCSLPHLAHRSLPLHFSARCPKRLHLKQCNGIGMYCLTLNFKYPN